MAGTEGHVDLVTAWRQTFSQVVLEMMTGDDGFLVGLGVGCSVG